MARPENREGADANMVRDELRIATRKMQEATAAAEYALGMARRFLRGEANAGERTGAVRLQTPADPYTAGVPVTRAAPGGLAELIREDEQQQP